MIKKTFLLLTLISCLSLFIVKQIEAVRPTTPQGSLMRKVSPGLMALNQVYLRKGTARAAAYAWERGHVLDNDMIEVVMEFNKGWTIDETRVSSMGVSVECRYRNLLLARMPLQKLEVLSISFQGLGRIRLPYRPHEVVESEGVDIMGGSDLQLLGYTGQGVKVAIIDLGFGQLSSAQSAGELPNNLTTMDFTGTGIGGNKHGTGVAEVVYDMAPDAELYLLKIANSVQLGKAKDYCITNGIQIINHSLAWFNVAFYDGTGAICDIANDAYNNGILWTNATGNYANTHYEATLTDTDNDRKHEFSGMDESLSFSATAGKTVIIDLNWDAYPATREDYDLFLYDVDPETDPGASPVASSEYSQGPIQQPPVEELVYSIPVTGTYYLVVQKKSTSDADLPLDIYFFSTSSLEYKNSKSSLAQPADASGVLAVGAVSLTDTLRGYSSRGPTNDGRTKPDVTATDGIFNYTYGTFSGTSSASPHAAGAAALILSQAPALTVDQLWDQLEADTLDLGSAGKDTLYGSGRISLDADEDGVIHDLDNCLLFPNAGQEDADSDGLGDLCDNCTLEPNIDQRDTNGDGYGNICDTDLDNDNITNFLDLGSFKSVFMTSDADADFDGDGNVNFLDLGILKSSFMQPPGPSGLAP